MSRGSSVITDQRYYAVHRTETTGEVTRVALEDCGRFVQSAPTPGMNLRLNGRRPHKHGDRENHYVDDRIELNPRLRGETNQSAVLHTGGLPVLAAYPAREFDYAHQNRRGADPQGDAGYNRIITDTRKNQLGLSYHPLGSRDEMIRAEVQGAFIADYRRDSLKQEPERQTHTTPSGRSSTWPKQ